MWDVSRLDHGSQRVYGVTLYLGAPLRYHVLSRVMQPKEVQHAYT